MAIRTIVKHPNKVLETNCEAVTVFDKNLSVLLDDMHETMVESDGVGIAAPQVGEAVRVAIVDFREGQEPIEMINPELVLFEGAETDIEGCLSFPGVFGEVERYDHIKIKAQERDGSWYELEAEDYEARAILHEMDHLDGVLFTSKITKYVTQEELDEMIRQQEEEEEEQA
ncbi:Peptide deformylase [Planococcus halocryophilus Or1]|uniref:Peptide deformylase n=1 Tax=Planococcus halocryophilus TaxID=1215089 RepID=A0A1C7DQB1_9BACL|nr:peptide deformylase [Planococcus halocryophilus]ANU13592.1 peptide deformylase [Planococcus halocryophilus]EMF46392.1 Peptide deformylase [Planococcus halocryophilus Or1]